MTVSHDERQKKLFKKWPSKKIFHLLFCPLSSICQVLKKKKKKVKNTMTLGKSFKNDSWDWKFGGLLLKMPYHVLKLSSVRGGGYKKAKKLCFLQSEFLFF